MKSSDILKKVDWPLNRMPGNGKYRFKYRLKFIYWNEVQGSISDGNIKTYECES